MNAEPLSAYMLLMISDVGHHFNQFKSHALNMLSVLCTKGKYEAIFVVFCYMLPNFILDPEFCQDSRFLQLINMLFGCNYSTESFSRMDTIFKEYIQDLRNCEKEEILSSVDFWHKIIFSFQNFIITDLGIHIMDHISKMCFELGFSVECQESLCSILKEKIAEYNSSIENEVISIKNPVTSVYALKTYFTRTYPEIVPSIDFKCKYLNSRAWFAINGYLAEVRANMNDRRLIGSMLLTKGVLEDVGNSRQTPTSYVIYRLAREFLILKPNHVLAPIYLNLFLSLYFESDSPSQIFGHLTLMDSRNTSLDVVMDYIKRSARKLDELGKESNNDLRHLYNSFLLWLQDPHILTKGLSSLSISDAYLVERLEDCIKGSILKSGICSWAEVLLPVALEFDNSPSVDLHKQNLEVTYDSLVPLASPKSSLVVPLQTPLISKKNLNLDYIRNKIAVVLNILSGKAEEFNSLYKRLRLLESEYVDKLKLLYTRSSIRNRAQKTCSKECKSAAMFDYITYKIMAVSEVKLMLLDNRSTKESYLNHEVTDAKTCILGLELNLMAEWLGKHLSSNLDHTIGSDIFFGILEAIVQDPNLAQFHISKYQLKNLLSTLGELFISASAENNLKLWKLMANEDVIEMAGNSFYPACAFESFNYLYKDLCCRFKMSGDDITDSILAHFNVSGWLQGGVSADQMFDLFKSVIDSPFSVNEKPNSFITNRKLLRDLISHPSFRPMIPDAIGLCFSKIIAGPFSVFLFSEVTNSLFVIVPDTWQDNLDSLDLLESHFDREQLLNVIRSLKTLLHDYIMTSKKSILNFDIHTQNGIIRLLAIICCSKQLYSMITTFYFEELYSIWQSIYLEVIGILYDNGEWKYVAPWPEFDNVNNVQVIKNLNRMLEKFCRNSSQIAKVPVAFWEIITIILQMNLEDKIVECLASTFESSSLWKNFSISFNVTSSVKRWIVENKMTLSLTKCVLKILELGLIDDSIITVDTLQGPETERYSRDLVFILVFIVNQSISILPDFNDRIRIFSALQKKYFNLPWLSKIPVSDFSGLVDLFSLFKWNTLTCQLKEWQSSGDPLVFTIKFLQTVCGIDKVVCPASYYAVYKQFVVSLFSTHIFNHDSWNEAFSDNDITELVLDFLCEAEKIKIQGICDSTDIEFLGFKDLVGIFNRMSKNHDLYVKIWNGFLKVISVSKIPLEYLSCSSFCFSSGIIL